MHKGLQAFGFRTQDQWSSDSLNVFIPYHLGSFLPETDYGQVEYMFYPYWLGRKYTTFEFDSIQRFAYFGYIINPEDGHPNLSYSWIASNVVEAAKTYKTNVPFELIKDTIDEVDWHETQADLVLFIDGRDNTDYFLESEAARNNCINIAYEYVCKRDSVSKGNLFDADGVNVYFPDFSFKLKREYGLFIKNLYWKLKENKADKKLILTFPLRDSIHFKYLLGLEQYIDQLHLVNYDYRGVARDTALRNRFNGSFKADSTDLNLINEIIAEMRIAEYVNPFKPQSGSAKENIWEVYLIIICCISLLLIASNTLLFFWCKLKTLVSKGLTLYILVNVLLVAEILFLFIFMVEEMTFDVWLINTKNKESLLFLLIPFILLLLFPAINFLQKSKDLP